MRALLAGLAVVATCVAGAQQATPVARPRGGTIDGVVTDSALVPIENATVSVFGTRIRVATRETGRFRLADMPAGEYLLIVRRLGFEGATTKVAVEPDNPARIAFALVPVASHLANVEIISRPMPGMRMKEFNERRDRKEGGLFMTREDIFARNPSTALDLFRGIPSITIRPGALGMGALYSTRSNCEIQVLVDGLPIRRSDYPAPEQISGIEVYAGGATVPLEYKRAGTGCGLVLIWTGDGR